jgi:predicted porin
MKKVLSLAIAAALVAPAAAMADATLFGKAHFIIENVDTKASSGADSVDVWGVDSIHSRIGVKGSEDLGDGLTAVYHFEFKVNQDSGDGLGDRNQFIGLAGGFGTVLLGRHDTPMKMSQGKFDEFGDLPNGDLANVIPGDDRVDNVIAYVSPAMGGLTFVGALVAGERADLEIDGLADHISLAGLYSNGPIFASLAYNSYDLGTALDADPSMIRGTFIWNGGMWQVGGMYNAMDLDLDGVDDPTSMGLSGHLKVGSNGKIKAQYLMADSERAGIADVLAGFTPNVSISNGVNVDLTTLTARTEDNDVTQWSIGYEHSLSKRTTLHAGYTAYEEDLTGKEVDALFAGMIHNF